MRQAGCRQGLEGQGGIAVNREIGDPVASEFLGGDIDLHQPSPSGEIVPIP
jgi:hypothetical protein